jgi:hypothetical protein
MDQRGGLNRSRFGLLSSRSWMRIAPFFTKKAQDRPQGRNGRAEIRACIRINVKWRICFEWPQGATGPSDVEIVDYH